MHDLPLCRPWHLVIRITTGLASRLHAADLGGILMTGEAH